MTDGIKISVLEPRTVFDGSEELPLVAAGGNWRGNLIDLGNFLVQRLGINRPPTSSDHTASTSDTAGQVTGNLLVGASDPDRDIISIQAFSYNGTSETLISGSFQTALGLMFVDPSSGNWTFTLGQGARALNVGQVGHEVFTYTLADGKGGLSTSTLTITIVGTNSVPVVNYVNSYTPVNTTVTGNLIAHYAFDYESDLTITQFVVAGDATVNAPGSTAVITGVGTITINANGDYTFVPVADWFGPVPVITYTLADVGAPPNLVNAFLTLAVTPLVAGVSPIVLWTNNPSGPVSGGENGKGCFLTICGLRFGNTAGLGSTTKVYVGGVEVARYFPLQDAAVAPRFPGLQALTVQVNNMDSSTLGVPQAVTVVVNGNASNANWHFTPNPGNFYYVSLGGNDATGTANDITKPFRTLQHPTRTDPAVWPNLHAGDHVIVRGGAWSDLGYDTSWCRFRDPQQMGSNPTGVAGTGWICFMPYPGETVTYEPPAGGNKGGFQGPGQAFAGTTGEWIAVSNFVMSVPGGSARDAAPVNMQYSTGHWRVSNMALGPWVAGSSPVLNAACITGAGNFVDILGNYCHDIEGTVDQQNHGLYAGTLSYGWNIGFNWFQNCVGGSHIQFNDSDGGTGVMETPFGVWQGFTQIRIHHNFLEVAAKYSINFADVGAHAGDLSFIAWNNVIVGTDLPPLRLNTTTNTSDCLFAFNTIYDCCRTFSGSGNGYFRNEAYQQAPERSVKLYNNIFAFGPNTVAGCGWFADYSGLSTGVAWSRNLYFANGQSPTNVADALGVYGDPKFNNPAGLDFSLQASSPAINAGTQALPAGVTIGDDFTSQASRLFGGAPDIGAIEYGQTTPFVISAPTASGGVQVGVANSCTVGTWGNSPTGYSRQAYVNGVAAGAAITGTGSASYTPVAGDAGGVLSWQVSATNAQGTTVYTITLGTIAAGAGAPVNTVLPAISGTTQVGNTLTTTDGTWTGTVDSYSYQWLRNGAAITGATANSYALVGADVGTRISVRVTANNATTGNVSATSAQTGVISAASANPTYVQEIAGTTAAAADVTLTLPSNVTSTDLLIGWFAGWDQAPDNYTKTDTQGNTFTNGARVSAAPYNDNPHGQFFWTKATASGAYSLTLNQNGGQNGSGVFIEVSGIDASTIFDIAQDALQGSGTAITLGASAATTKPNDLILVGVAWSGTGKTIALPDSSWTQVAAIDGTYNGCALFMRKISAVETFSFAGTLSATGYWCAQSVVIKGS